MQERLERRMAMRVLASVPVAVEYGGQYAEATLRDISVSGARVDATPFDAKIGGCAKILLVLSLSESAYEIDGEVVRRSPNGGFAVRFTAMDPRLKEALSKAGQHAASLPDTPPS